MKLLREEQLVVKWVSQYGALLRNQVVALLHGVPMETIEKVLYNLIQHFHLYELPGDYLSLDPIYKPDNKMIAAVWVLIQFIQDIDSMAHYPGSYPSQVYFLKGNTGYSIIVLDKGQESLLKLTPVQEDMKYIIVIDDPSQIASLPSLAAPCLFAIVDDFQDSKVSFYAMDDK